MNSTLIIIITINMSPGSDPLHPPSHHFIHLLMEHAPHHHLRAPLLPLCAPLGQVACLLFLLFFYIMGLFSVWIFCFVLVFFVILIFYFYSYFLLFFSFFFLLIFFCYSLKNVFNYILFRH